MSHLTLTARASVLCADRYQKRLQGSLYRQLSPSAGIPWLINLYTSGALNLDDLVTTSYPLDDIAKDFDDLHAGENLRGVIRFG